MIVNIITKDWQVGLIFVDAERRRRLRSGRPNDNNLTDGIQRGQIVPGVDPYLPEDQRRWVPDAGGFNTRMAWFNLDAFTVNPIGTYGDSPRGYLTGPAFWNADLAFSRLVRLGSTPDASSCALEAFNLFDT